MDKQDRLRKRRERAAKRTDKVMHASFISEYVRIKYNDAYKEADRVYYDIKEKNPNRKNMLKTVDFLQLTTPYSSYPVYYYSRRKTAREARRNKGDSTPKRTRNTDNMVLNIDLIPSDEIPAHTHEIPPPAIEQHEIPPQTPAIEQDEIPPQTPAIEQDEIPPQPPAIEQDEIPLQLDIPAYEAILQELRQDPDLYRIFNNFNTPDNDDDMDIPSNEDMWDVITTAANEPTPLERELSQLDY